MASLQQNPDSGSSISSSIPETSYPPGASYASSPITPPHLSRNHSRSSAEDTHATTDDSISEPAPPAPRRRPSRLNSSGSGNSKEYRTAAAAAPAPADETTAIAARSDPRNYAATVSTNHPSTREEVTETVVGWFGKFGAIELENKGSVARDHLALERTFLAWLRTSLAFASIGIAITQLFRLNAAVVKNPDPSDDGYTTLRHMGKPLGATFIGISILVLLIGVNRYYESQTWLQRGKFPASRGSIFLLTLVACLLMITTLVIVLVVQPSNYER